MTQLSVTDAVVARRSTRAFLDKPVPLELLQELLLTAQRCPSGGNLQPWRIYALSGAPLETLRAEIAKTRQAQPRGEGFPFKMYGKDTPEPYRSRAFKCGEDLYATLGIAREDKPARLAQFGKNFEMFGAPVVLLVFIDRWFDIAQWGYLGMYVQTVMLLAQERGLGTCPQEAMAAMHGTISRTLGVPPELRIYCGIALGYPDPDAQVNRLVTDRADLSEVVTFKGFSA